MDFLSLLNPCTYSVLTTLRVCVIVIDMQPYRQRLIPYKLLVQLLYGKHPWIERLPDGSLRVQTGPLRRYLRISAGRVLEQFEWLRDNQFLTSLEKPAKGVRLLTLKKPEVSDV